MSSSFYTYELLLVALDPPDTTDIALALLLAWMLRTLNNEDVLLLASSAILVFNLNCFDVWLSFSE